MQADPAVERVCAAASRQPRFAGQRVVSRDTTRASGGRVDLGEMSRGCSLVALYDVLAEERVDSYVEAAAAVTRTSGRSAYGHAKPRREVCYRPADDASSYAYSGIAHETVPYPAHVLALLPEFRALVAAHEPRVVAEFSRLSHGVDIVYSREFARGGSIGAHGDDEQPDWGLVLVYSLGQTRWLRVRHRATGTWTNVEMRHNSLVAMCGAAFQRDFTHQVDKLGKDEPVEARLSLNVRYGRPSGSQPRDGANGS